MISQRQIDEAIANCEVLRDFCAELLAENPNSNVALKEFTKHETILEVLAWINSGTDKSFSVWEIEEKEEK